MYENTGKNGTIVTAESEYKADILIVDEKVTSIGTNLEGPFDRILDAEGKYVLPGGVDNHAHFEALNTDGITTNEPYATTWVALQEERLPLWTSAPMNPA